MEGAYGAARDPALLCANRPSNTPFSPRCICARGPWCPGKGPNISPRPVVACVQASWMRFPASSLQGTCSTNRTGAHLHPFAARGPRIEQVRIYIRSRFVSAARVPRIEQMRIYTRSRFVSAASVHRQFGAAWTLERSACAADTPGRGAVLCCSCTCLACTPCKARWRLGCILHCTGRQSLGRQCHCLRDRAGTRSAESRSRADRTGGSKRGGGSGTCVKKRRKQ